MNECLRQQQCGTLHSVPYKMMDSPVLDDATGNSCLEDQAVRVDSTRPGNEF